MKPLYHRSSKTVVLWTAEIRLHGTIINKLIKIRQFCRERIKHGAMTHERTNNNNLYIKSGDVDVKKGEEKD